MRSTSGCISRRTASGQACRHVRSAGRLLLSAEVHVPGDRGRHGTAGEARIRAERPEDLATGTVRLADESEQQMLAADVVVAKAGRLGHGGLQHIRCRHAETAAGLARSVDAALAGTGLVGHRPLEFPRDHRRVDIHRSQYLEREIRPLADQTAEQVRRGHRRPVDAPAAIDGAERARSGHARSHWAGGSRDVSPFTPSNPAWRIAVILRTACSRARWQMADTGTPAVLTASASSSGR